MPQAKERPFSIRERLLSHKIVREIVAPEPPDCWFKKTIDEAGNMQVTVSEDFLSKGNHRMELCWKYWSQWSPKLAAEEVRSPFVAEDIQRSLYWFKGQIMAIVPFFSREDYRQNRPTPKSDG